MQASITRTAPADADPMVNDVSRLKYKMVRHEQQRRREHGQAPRDGLAGAAGVHGDTPP